MVATPHRASVRRADASRNDVRILAAARAVFSELGPDAPVSVIAQRAGVGMGTLYRRYPSKGELMRHLLLANMTETRQAAEAALGNPNPWEGFIEFIDTCIEAGVDGSLRLSGSFPVFDDILRESRRTREAIQRLVDRAQRAGALRLDINAHDVVLVLHTLRELRVAHKGRDLGLRQRFLGIVLDGLRAGSASPLPAPPATWSDVEQAWRTVAGETDPVQHRASTRVEGHRE